MFRGVGPGHFPGHEFAGQPGLFIASLILRAALFAAFFLVPWIIGLTYVRSDAKRRGQPGWLWALVTFPLGWLAIIAYLIVRATDRGARPQLPAENTL